MVVEHYMDLQDDTGQIDMTGLRCTSCGEVVDAVILENREIGRASCRERV